MSEAIVKIRFTATPEVKTWLHEKASAGQVPWGKGMTVRVRPAVVLSDGETAETDKWTADWCVTHYPTNFSLVPTRERKPTTTVGSE